MSKRQHSSEELGGTPRKKMPPKHIGKAGTAWWLSVIEGRTPDATDYALMVLAAECLDGSDAARLEIEKEGMVVPTKFGCKTNPHVAVERGHKQMFARLVRQLDIKPLEA